MMTRDQAAIDAFRLMPRIRPWGWQDWVLLLIDGVLVISLASPLNVFFLLLLIAHFVIRIADGGKIELFDDHLRIHREIVASDISYTNIRVVQRMEPRKRGLIEKVLARIPSSVDSNTQDPVAIILGRREWLLSNSPVPIFQPRQQFTVALAPDDILRFVTTLERLLAKSR